MTRLWELEEQVRALAKTRTLDTALFELLRKEALDAVGGDASQLETFEHFRP